MRCYSVGYSRFVWKHNGAVVSSSANEVFSVVTVQFDDAAAAGKALSATKMVQSRW